MREKGGLNMKIVLAALVVAILVPAAVAETLYIDSRNGNDTNPGTKEKPLRTIGRAGVMVNSRTEGGPTTIKIGPGIYGLDKTVVFENRRPYTEKNRLVIEATILPDELRWGPTLMPVIVSVEDPRKSGRLNEHTETYSLKIKVSHVTIRGLKFLGNPLSNNWHACIERWGEDLDDLLVTQCMFVGDKNALDVYCPAIAMGDRFVVDHCIFYNCNASAVFWDGLEGIGGKGCAMRYCIVDGGGICGVWTCQTAEDFEFHHNIVTRCEYFWMRKGGDKQRYRVSDCVVSKNKYYSGYGSAAGPSGRTGPEVAYGEKNVVREGEVVLEKNKKARNYLYPLPGTLGSDLGAGVFTKLASEIEPRSADSGRHTGQLEIQFIGNAAFHITDGKSTLLVDFPYESGAYGYMQYKMENIKPFKDGLSLITHSHADHWNQALFEKMDHAIIAPPDILEKVKSKKKISFDNIMRYKNITVQAFETPHDPPGKFQHYSYLVTWHDLRLYIPGAAVVDYALTMKDIDIMFLGEWYTSKIESQEIALDAQTLIIFHQKEGQEIPSSPNYLVLKQGEMIKVGFKEKQNEN